MSNEKSMVFSHDPYSHAPNNEVPLAPLATVPQVPNFVRLEPNPFDIVWSYWHFDPMDKHPCLAIFGCCQFGSVCQLSAMGRWVCWDCIQGKPHDLCRGLPPPAHPCERLHQGKCTFGANCKIRDCPRSWCPHCLRGSPHKVCNGIKPYFLKPKKSNETVVVDSYEGHSFPFLPKDQRKMKIPKMESSRWNEVVPTAETHSRILATVQRAGLNNSQEIQVPYPHSIRTIENVEGDVPWAKDVAMQATAPHPSPLSKEAENKTFIVAVLKEPYNKEENGVIVLLEGSPQDPSGAFSKKEGHMKVRKS